MADPDVGLHDLLNAQTGRVAWPELARHFARGVVVCVATEEDLLTIAELIVRDRAEEIERLYAGGQLHRATDRDAARWQDAGTEFWAVVVAPWVLVQESGATERSPD
jgi:hypothetical protein